MTMSLRLSGTTGVPNSELDSYIDVHGLLLNSLVECIMSIIQLEIVRVLETKRKMFS